jgi:hypothetical protein
MRRGFAPIAAAARMELHYPEPDVAPPEALDVDAAFQLTLPLLWLPPEVSGTCRLDVRIPGEGDFAVGAMAEVAEGRVVSSTPLLEEKPETLITGTPLQWLDTLVDPSSPQLARRRRRPDSCALARSRPARSPVQGRGAGLISQSDRSSAARGPAPPCGNGRISRVIAGGDRLSGIRRRPWRAALLPIRLWHPASA